MKKALKKLRACTFDLVLETRYADFEGTPFTLGANAADVAPKKRGFLKRVLGAIPILGIAFRSKNPNEIPVSVKKDIARVKTLLRELEIAEDGE